MDYTLELKDLWLQIYTLKDISSHVRKQPPKSKKAREAHMGYPMGKHTMIHTHIYISVYIYTYMCVCVCVCVCVTKNEEEPQGQEDSTPFTFGTHRSKLQ